MEKEFRNLPSELAEVQVGKLGVNKDSRNVEGYGIVFNSESREMTGTTKQGNEIRFYEKILPAALSGVIEKSDILALMDHDISRGVLARSTRGKGSMKLTMNNKGLKYAFEAPRTSLGDELIEGIKRGDIRTSSFGFSVGEGQKWERRNDGTYLRTISKFDTIFDVSPCYREAYIDTSIALRSLDKSQNTEKPSSDELKQYFADLEEKMKNK